MAQTVELKIVVEDSQIDAISKKIEQLGGKLEKVEKQSGKAGSKLEEVGKNGGAIATLDRLTGGLASQIRDAAESTKVFNGSLKATRTALIATGIGAFVVALGLVVAYWDDIVDFVNQTNKGLERQMELHQQNLSNLDAELAILDEQEKILKLQGKSTEEIVEQKKAVLLIQQEENAALLENLRIQLEREKAQIKEITLWEKIKIAAAGAFGGAGGRAIAEASAVVGSAEDNERLRQVEDLLNQSRVRAEQLKLSLLQLDQPDATTSSASGGRRGKVTGVSDVEGGRLGVFGENPLEAAFQTELEITNIKANALADRAKNDEAYAKFLEQQREDDLKREEALAQYKIQTAANVLGALSMIAEEGSSGAKAIAVAQAILSTYQGINKALAETTDFTPTQTLRFANAAAVGIAGFANVAKILSTNASGQGASIGGGGGAPNVTKAPSFNVVGTSGVNQLAETLQGQDEPVRAYVVGSDVTSQQALDRNIEESITLS